VSVARFGSSTRACSWRAASLGIRIGHARIALRAGILMTNAELSEKVLGGLEVAVDVIDRAAKNYLSSTGSPNLKALQHMAAAAVLLGRAADALQNERADLRLVR